MKRLTLIGSWRRRGLHFGLLAGTALAFVGGSEPAQLAAGPKACWLEGPCNFKKPLLAFVLDSSTAMNQVFAADATRWETAVALVPTLVDLDNGYVAQNFVLGLIRFGHDPDPNLPGTTIAGDGSGLVDGQKFDVPWYDANDPDKKYIECVNGDAIVAALNALPAPLNGAKTGIDAWTRGALEFAKSSIVKATADHPEDLNQRAAVLVVLTTGEWTDATGMMKQSPVEQDPTLTAADLWVNQSIPTLVVAFGGPADKPLADALAAAGGTDQAIDPAAPLLLNALKSFLDIVQANVVLPVCTPVIPRVMILLDASSSMLNVGDVRAAPGQGNWDRVREKLAGDAALFDIVLADDPNNTADQKFYFGLSVFGSPTEEKLLVQYNACRKPHFAWALDPASSCEAPGCLDPYAPPPVQWTFKDGAMIDPPGFKLTTLSHVPRCDQNEPQPQACSGSGSSVHLGLELVQTNIGQYRAMCQLPDALLLCNDETPFVNVLITDGAYDSTDAQVKDPLVSMHEAGIVTHVIGFGDALELDQLEKMADWGSGNALDPVVAVTQDQLEAAFQALLKPPVFHPCCGFTDCNGFGDEGGEASGPPPDDPSTGDASTTAPIDPDTGSSSPSTASTTTPGPSTSVSTSDGPAPTSDGPVPTSDGPATTSDGATAGTDTDDGPSEVPSDTACGCRSTEISPMPALLLLGLLGRRRRRRRSATASDGPGIEDGRVSQPVSDRGGAPLRAVPDCGSASTSARASSPSQGRRSACR